MPEIRKLNGWVCLEFKLRGACSQCGADVDIDVIGFDRAGEFCDVKASVCASCIDEAESAGYHRCEKENGL